MRFADVRFADVRFAEERFADDGFADDFFADAFFLDGPRDIFGALAFGRMTLRLVEDFFASDFLEVFLATMASPACIWRATRAPRAGSSERCVESCAA